MGAAAALVHWQRSPAASSSLPGCNSHFAQGKAGCSFQGCIRGARSASVDSGTSWCTGWLHPYTHQPIAPQSTFGFICAQTFLLQECPCLLVPDPFALMPKAQSNVAFNVAFNVVSFTNPLSSEPRILQCIAMAVE